MTAALILAAGSLTEGGKYNPTEKIGDVTPIQRLVSAFEQAGVERTVIITGYNAEHVERHSSKYGAIFLRNNAYETSDMLSSVKIGLEYLKGKAARVFITPADVPFFSVNTLRTMMSNESDNAQVLMPVCNSIIGHPLLVSADTFDTIMEYDGSNGLQGILSSRALTRKFVEVADDGVLFDFSDNTRLAELLSTFPRPKIKAGAKLWLAGNNAFFGPGTYRLLEITLETGSLKTASRQIGISYGKARSVIANSEKALGYQIVASQTGGKNGGRSEVTARGLELMRRYAAFTADCNESIREAFERHFGDAKDLW